MHDYAPLNRRVETGFTLVEVLMSVVIMMIGFVAVFGLVTVSDRTLQKSRALSELNAIGNDVIESVVSDRENLAEYSWKCPLIPKNPTCMEKLSATSTLRRAEISVTRAETPVILTGKL
mgnify:CR=1 FL=1